MATGAWRRATAVDKPARVLAERFRVPLAACLALALLVSQAALGAPPDARPTPVKPRDENDPRFTLVLRAMNTSRERPSIDVEVTIDGAVVVRDRLSSEGQKDFSIPPSKTFPLEIPPGKHLFRATSSEASASLQREIVIRKKHWALLSYEPGPDKSYRFTLTIQNEPIYFQ
ncbi:MAG TPA: hypothetical protein VKH43_11240 [Thermoanaerobaculia bacterium]|nr:hypothetical protein [Thermoanaerobaculia bacterium]